MAPEAQLLARHHLLCSSCCIFLRVNLYEIACFFFTILSYSAAGSSSWIDFTNPEIRKWWAGKFALSEYPVGHLLKQENTYQLAREVILG